MRLRYALFTLCLFPGFALGEFETGNSLLPKCAGQLGNSTAFCLGYIASVVDNHQAFVNWGTISAQVVSGVTLIPWPFCLPEGATLGQLQLVLAKYLHSHPEQLHERASDLVKMALHESFPCQSSTTKP